MEKFYDDRTEKDVRLLRLARHGLNLTLRENFSHFVRRCFVTINPGVAYLQNWHIDLIGEYLEACRRHDITRLIINMPPRALKSTVVSVAWPAFLLGHKPSERIMTASYAASLSMKHSLDCRRILQADWYGELFPDLELADDQNEKHKFQTTAYGHRIATSVGGSATGEGGNFLIVDDPQSPAQVMSDASRQVAKEWFDHTFSSRLDDKRNGVIVVVMQRLHEDDLSGHLLSKGGWEHLKLPAVTDAPIVYCFGKMYKARAAGEVLHDAREDAELVARAKTELGSYAFAAQYQQEPVPAQGGMVKRSWFGRYDANVLDGVSVKIVQSWDTGIKSGKHHDASVCLTFAQAENVSYVLDVEILRLEYPELKKAMLNLAHAWEPDAILIEDKASGQSLLQDLRRETRLPIIACMPVADKVTRFAAVSALIEAGKLYLPKEAPWLAAFETELLGFPQAPHDDQVDALTQYLGWVRKHAGIAPRIRRF